ncbi:MAG: hypothetical protein ACI8R4_003586 [Paracoccaceae bacterium]|jgi:hypothetical protein
MLILLTVIFISGVVAALVLPEWSDLLLIAGPCTLACIFLWVRNKIRHAHTKQDTQKRLVLDGSNILHWKDGTPQIETLREVIRHISTLGFTPGVVFDANAGYLISDKYLHDTGFSMVLGLPAECVMVVPKGSPADPTILDAARKLGAQVVTNDRFRDWAENYPEVADPGFLIRGGYRSGRLWLELDAEVSA